MVKVTFSGGQYRITLPKEIIEMKAWKDGTELIFVPIIKEPTEELTEKTALLIREVRGKR